MSYVSAFQTATTLGDIKDALVAFFNVTWPVLAQSISFGIGNGTTTLDPLNFNGTVNGSYGDCGWRGGWTCASFNLSGVAGLKDITTSSGSVNDPYIQDCNGTQVLLGSVGGTLNSLSLGAQVHAQVVGLGGDFTIGVSLNQVYATISWRVPCIRTSTGPDVWTIQFSQATLGVNLSLNGVSGINGFPSWANKVVDPVVNLVLSALNGTIQGAVQGVLSGKFTDLVRGNVPDVQGLTAGAVVCSLPPFVSSPQDISITRVLPVTARTDSSIVNALVLTLVAAVFVAMVLRRR